MRQKTLKSKIILAKKKFRFRILSNLTTRIRFHVQMVHSLPTHQSTAINFRIHYLYREFFSELLKNLQITISICKNVGIVGGLFLSPTHLGHAWEFA